MEWTSQFNPFHSLKALAWRESFEAITRGEIPFPISTHLDACNSCNLNCSFCEYLEYREEKPDFMSEEDLLWACDAIKKLGAVSTTFGGGGEGLVHPSAGIIMRYLKDIGIHTGMITNGVYADRFLNDITYSLDWIGMSIDAASPENYAKLKGATTTDFFSVINNIKQIVRKRKNGIPTVTFKFLLHPDNYHEILDAAKLAQSIGADYMHIRPAYGSRDGHKPIWYQDMIKESHENIKHAMSLETANFHVYGVMHKYEEDFDKIVLDKCEVTPIAGLTFAADGYCYACCNLRGEEQGRMCKWHDILDYWGSDEHKELLKNLDPQKCPYRCDFCPYQEILEKVFKNDEMNFRFP